MIHLAKPGESLFNSRSSAIVNPVNTVGVMGAGLAKEFARRFPAACKPYFDACQGQQMAPGSILPVRVLPQDNPNFGVQWVIHFPTKAHWRNPSQLVYIKDGLADLARFCRQQELASVALPALGCGLGGLPFDLVVQAIYTHLGDLVTDVTVYPPGV